MHGSVLGLEVVLPDEKGTVLSVGMNGLRKDNTGAFECDFSVLYGLYGCWAHTGFGQDMI